MKLTILTGILVLATGFTLLAARQTTPAQAAPAQGAPAQPTGPHPKSPAEGEAVVALRTAAQSGDSDAMIKAAEDLITKFSDTDYKEYALSLEAQAYKNKRDSAHAEIYAQQALQINPKSYSMDLLLGEVVESSIGDHDLTRDDEIKSATKDFNDAIEFVKSAPKPNPQVSDDQWALYQKYLIAEAHNGLGVLAMIRKDWPTGIAEFKLAVEGDPQDAYSTRLASVYNSAGQYDDAIATCDKLLANPALNPVIKDVVTKIRNASVAGKNKK